MLQAGCTYGMHLDMNPHHTGFVFASVRSYANKDYDARLLTPAMEIMAERYLEWAPKDFFYIMLREPAPAGELAWSPDPATQPAPAWLPAVWRAVVPPSSSGGKGAEVELLAFDTQRVAFRVRPGVRQHKSTRSAAETDAASVDHDFLSEELSSDDGHRVIASIGLGNPPKEGREARMASAGLAAEGAEGYLVAREETGIRIAAAPELARDGLRGELALPWLLQDGKLVLSHERSARPRGAICEAATGHVVVALATTDSDEPLGRALMDLGCTRALVLDRGSHRSTFVHRAGGASPPLSRYDESALYAISAAMPARAFRWRP
jgi:hypothetical protein